MVLCLWNSETKEKRMSDSFSNIGVGVNFDDPISVQVNGLITYANLYPIEVVRISPTGEVFLDGEKHGDLNDFRPDDVVAVYQELYRLAGMWAEDEPPYVGDFCWPVEKPVINIRVACVPVNPTTVEVVFRFIAL